MSDLVPQPRMEISIRPATVADISFIDRLQKLHANQVGWMPLATLEGKLKLGHVFVAERTQPLSHRGTENAENLNSDSTSSFSVPQCRSGELAGYVIGNDQYFKRDDVGIIYQMNVDPQYQRGYVGAALLKYMFDRSAYGCKLFCCWCAQDIGANRFWENMGFVPLAFRAGSTGKKRVHIFWQKRIREGDTTTPYWYPSKTDSGAMREDRVVLPIPPGTHWSEVHAPEFVQNAIATLPEPKKCRARKKPTGPVIEKHDIIQGGFRFAGVNPIVPTEKPKKEPKPKVKLDPQIKQAARELRDRWLEQVNGGNAPIAIGKYNLARQIEAVPAKPLLAA